MAHFAKLDENNIVLEVLVVPNEQEHRGQEYLVNDCGLSGTWIQTSYNGNFRKNFAKKGGVYNLEKDAFISPKPGGIIEYVLNEDTCKWEFKYPMPTDGKSYQWNLDTKTWIEVTNE